VGKQRTGYGSSGEKPATGQLEAGRERPPIVGRVLRRAREHRHLSLREVERRIGRSSAYLSQVERGLIRQPDPVVLLALADLYRLDFMELASWAGWSARSEKKDSSGVSANALVRRLLELKEDERAEVFTYIEGILRERRT
jgi:transcriptional regulator with XRE-family HTH domain